MAYMTFIQVSVLLCSTWIFDLDSETKEILREQI
jgi:hypothetical protein